MTSSDEKATPEDWKIRTEEEKKRKREKRERERERGAEERKKKKAREKTKKKAREDDGVESVHGDSDGARDKALAFVFPAEELRGFDVETSRRKAASFFFDCIIK